MNAIIGVFDLIRARTGLQLEGAALAAEAFSLKRPRLILSDLSTTSGQDEQKGFIQILQGVFQAIRNPKAHSLAADVDERKSWQYLVLASYLIRRIKEAQLSSVDPLTD